MIILRIALRRLQAQPGLAFSAICGFAISIALMMSIPLYADAVLNRTLKEEVIKKGLLGETLRRSPFSFLFSYSGTNHGGQDWERVQPVDQFLATSAEAEIGLPMRMEVRLIQTTPGGLVPWDKAKEGAGSIVSWYPLAFTNDIESHIRMLDGSLPGKSYADDPQPIEVMIGSSLAQRANLQVGDRYQVFIPSKSAEGRDIYSTIPVVISGIWEPLVPDDVYWIIHPRLIGNMLVMDSDSFLLRVSPQVPNEVNSAFWYIVMDGSQVHTDDVPRLLSRIARLRFRANTFLTHTVMDESPENALRVYQISARRLTILLYAFAIPILMLTLAFITLVARLGIDRQQNEIAVMRSRGATIMQMFGLGIVQNLILVSIALVLGVVLSFQVSRLVGQTRSFLEFARQTDLQVRMSSAALYAAASAVVVSLLATLLPMTGAARHTLISYKREMARSLKPPVWQRVWLDFLLLIPAGYGAYEIRQQGGIVGANLDPFSNPLLFLVPSLGILALTLLLLRLLPPILGLLSWLASKTRSVSFHMAARHLARAPATYSVPFVVLALTMSLSAYTVSLAETIDQHLSARIHYNVGSDLSFLETGRKTGSSKPGEQFYFPPVQNYLQVPGLVNVARVGKYGISLDDTWGAPQVGKYFGVDPIDFSRVGFWRSDFAGQSLGELMNRLVAKPNGVLVSRGFLAENALQVGDSLHVFISTYEKQTPLDVEIVGTFTLFPGWYPQEGPLFVGSLDYLFEMAYEVFPYAVWARTDGENQPADLWEQIRKIGTSADFRSAEQEITFEQLRPDRQGLFGVLMIGLLSTVLMALLGFLLYILFSYRKRFIELGVIRAVGLSAGQMFGYLAWELIFLVVSAGAIGAWLGYLVSRIFIPYLQFGSEPALRTPPFYIIIAWPLIFQIYAFLGLTFIVVLAGTVYMLWKMKIFQALKLGETI